METELKPKFEGCVAYWGRAHVGKHRASASTYLRSYDTVVCYVDVRGGFHRTWGGWSRTTSRHVVEFWRQFCGHGPVPYKKAWEAMPVEAVFAKGRTAVSDLVSMEAKP